jgi:hypothetical protein
METASSPSGNMTRLETEPATPNQVGVIRREFGRLGLGADGRAERLAISAALLGLGGLDSTRDLTMGEAGRLYRMLLDFRHRDELATAVDLGGEGQGGAPAYEKLASDGVSLADALLRVMPPAFAAWQGWRLRRPLAEDAGPGPGPAATPATKEIRRGETRQDPGTSEGPHSSACREGTHHCAYD